MNPEIIPIPSSMFILFFLRVSKAYYSLAVFNVDVGLDFLPAGVAYGSVLGVDGTSGDPCYFGAFILHRLRPLLFLRGLCRGG